MEQDVKVWVEGDHAYLKAPWHADLGLFVSDMASKWDRDRGIFTFPVALFPHVEALAMAFFSTSGSAPLSHFLVDASVYQDVRAIEIAGRTLLIRERPSRRPVLAPRTIKLSGDFTWEGANKPFHAPLIGVNNAVLLTVLPASIATHGIPGLKMVQLPGREEALRAEGTRTFGRLQEIRRELGID